MDFPSTNHSVHSYCNDHLRPLTKPSNSATLFVVSPRSLKNTLSTLHLALRMTPTYLVQLGFPFTTPSKLSLKVPTVGHFQESRLCGGVMRAHKLLMLTSKLKNTPIIQYFPLCIVYFDYFGLPLSESERFLQVKFN